MFILTYANYVTNCFFFSNSFQTHPLTDSLETPVVANVSLPRSTVGDQARYNTAPSGSVINLREELRKMVSVMMQKRGAVLRFVCIQSALFMEVHCLLCMCAANFDSLFYRRSLFWIMYHRFKRWLDVSWYFPKFSKQSDWQGEELSSFSTFWVAGARRRRRRKKLCSVFFCKICFPYWSCVTSTTYFIYFKSFWHVWNFIIVFAVVFGTNQWIQRRLVSNWGRTDSDPWTK